LISKDIKTGVGEIVIKSDQVALGYLNESKNLTAETETA
jgi:acyl-CoA synthetase (AMP-forming)/AMP-acid ligase II